MNIGFSKKALVSSAFFIACSFAPALSLAACPLLPITREAQVRKVVDGDTVYLADGDRVRLIGVNATEVGHKGGRDEPFSREAEAALKRLVEGRRVGLSLGQQHRDHYGRLLAHLYVGSVNVEERLIAEGLGYAVSIAPNQALSSCLFAREQDARKARLGLWKHPALVAANALAHGGFQRVEGDVTAVSEAKRAWYIEMDDNLAVRISHARVDGRQQQWLQSLRGQRLIVRGWVVDRQAGGKRLRSGHKRWLISISDLRHIEVAH